MEFSIRAFLFALLATIALSVRADPCVRIDRSLSPNRKDQLAPAIAKQLNMNAVDILRSFKYQGWYIILAETHVSDEPFPFFKGDPIQEKYIALWSGAAGRDEEQSIREWTLKNAQGIPPPLAACFAWHVTRAR